MPTTDINFHLHFRAIKISSATNNRQSRLDTHTHTIHKYAQCSAYNSFLWFLADKPIWRYSQHIPVQYVYPNGSVTIACEAIAEPPANFTWYKNGSKKRLHNDKHHAIEKDFYASTLTIYARNDDVFDTYRCLAENQLGAIERNTVLKRGVKPPPPSVLQLRGFNSNTFDVDVGSVRVSPARTAPSKTEQLMEVNGFRIEYMTEYEFKSDGGKWTNAKRRDFPFEDGKYYIKGGWMTKIPFLDRLYWRLEHDAFSANIL